MKHVNLMERGPLGKKMVVATYLLEGKNIRIESNDEYGREIAAEIGREGIRSGTRRYYLKDGLNFLESLALEYNGTHFWATNVLDATIIPETSELN